MSELIEGSRSKVQAARVLGALADAFRESAAELEAFLEVGVARFASAGKRKASREHHFLIN